MALDWLMVHWLVLGLVYNTVVVAILILLFTLPSLYRFRKGLIPCILQGVKLGMVANALLLLMSLGAISWKYAIPPTCDQELHACTTSKAWIKMNRDFAIGTSAALLLYSLVLVIGNRAARLDKLKRMAERRATRLYRLI